MVWLILFWPPYHYMVAEYRGGFSFFPYLPPLGNTYVNEGMGWSSETAGCLSA